MHVTCNIIFIKYFWKRYHGNLIYVLLYFNIVQILASCQNTFVRCNYIKYGVMPKLTRYASLHIKRRESFMPPLYTSVLCQIKNLFSIQMSFLKCCCFRIPFFSSVITWYLPIYYVHLTKSVWSFSVCKIHAQTHLLKRPTSIILKWQDTAVILRWSFEFVNSVRII